jgi:hypothetical protein
MDSGSWAVVIAWRYKQRASVGSARAALAATAALGAHLGPRIRDPNRLGAAYSFFFFGLAAGFFAGFFSDASLALSPAIACNAAIDGAKK